MKNTLETRLGLFFALALVVAVLILEMIGGADFFKAGYQINASFKTAQELKKGDLVKMAGVEIGRVESIELADNRAKVTMKISGKYDKQVRTDSQATIKFTGLMGQNFISIEGGSPGAPSVAHGGTLETAEQPDLSAIMVKLENVASGVEGLTKSFSPENFSTLLGPITDFMSQNQTNLTEIISNVRTVTDNIAQGKGTVGRLINDPKLAEATADTITNLQSASADLRDVLGQAGGMVSQARGIVDQISAGQGTIGRFVKEDVFYMQTTNAMANLAEILQKVNRGTGSVSRLLNDPALFNNAKLGLQKLEKATEGLEDQGPLSVLGIAVNSLF